MKNTEDKKLKNIFFKKIYSAKEDGDSTSIFHQKCDGIKNVITFFKTIKGAKFGVYVQVGFGLGGGVYIADDEIFLFNINNRKIYNVKKVKKKQLDVLGIFAVSIFKMEFILAIIIYLEIINIISKII